MANFHYTAEIPSIRVEEGRFLRCLVAREDGEFVESEIDLDRVIGNQDGMYIGNLFPYLIFSK